MAPEYITEGVFSFKSDVFSFGVIVLEILSGKRNRVLNVADSRLNLLGHVSLVTIALELPSFGLLLPV